MPPEEAVTFVIPGFFGFSRQEGAYDTASIRAYYWGRMVFTQTTDYMGLLPWLLLPLPLIFRRDLYTWAAVAAVAGGILFSMGRYTPFYWFLYEHFPGVNHFRVPKMMMFIPVLGLGVLAARGVDLLLDREVRQREGFRRYVTAILIIPLLLLLLLLAETAGKDLWLDIFHRILAEPNRFERGPRLVMERWNNLVAETALALSLAAAYSLTIYFALRKGGAMRWLPPALLLLYCLDVGRVNDKFMLLQELPEKAKGFRTPVMEFLAKGSREYRTLPLNGVDPMQYASSGIPVMFTANAVQQVRWLNFIESFNLASSMPDMLNVRYLVCDTDQYPTLKGVLGGKYLPVKGVPDGGELLLESRTVLPKGWLVPSVRVIAEPERALAILRDPRFDPRLTALVESPPPIPLAPPDPPPKGSAGYVSVTRYEGNHIGVTARAGRNSLLVLGEKYFRGWKATVDGRPSDIHPVNHILRGVYLTPGKHRVEFDFDPLPFKVGKWITLVSFAVYAFFLGRELWLKMKKGLGTGD
jgi:hypothetical protein